MRFKISAMNIEEDIVARFDHDVSISSIDIDHRDFHPHRSEVAVLDAIVYTAFYGRT